MMPGSRWVENNFIFAMGWLRAAALNHPIAKIKLNDEAITPIYLGYSRDVPQPGEEARALLLLTPADIHQIVTEAMTLERYLAQGGKMLLREAIPQQLVLEPFVHLRWLHTLLQLHLEIADMVP